MLLLFPRKKPAPALHQPQESDDRRVVAMLNEARTAEDFTYAMKLARMSRRS